MLDREARLGHHWMGATPDPANNFGFIYMIIDRTSNKRYIGKKQYWIVKRGVTGCKTATNDRQSPKWKPSCWKESDWRKYKGSSPSLREWMEEHPDHDYEYHILRQCTTRAHLHYAEVQALIFSGALHLTVEDGEYLYFNRQCSAVKFRPKGYDDEGWLIDLEVINYV